VIAFLRSLAVDVKVAAMSSRGSAAAAEAVLARNLSIKVLGEFAVARDGIAAALPQSRKTRALLAYLAVVGRPQRRERLCEIFWDIPDDPRGALRWSLSRLRQVIGDVFETTRDTVALRQGAASTDYDRVRAALAAGAKPHLDELEAVAELFHGGFLDDLSLPRCPDFEAWRTALATEAELAQLRIRRALVEQLSADQPARALVHARALAAMNPGDEALAREIRSLAERSRQQASSPTRGVVPKPGAPTTGRLRLTQQIRYATAPDGVRLAYATTGAGSPILKCANWMSDLQYDLDSSVWRHWIEELSRHNQLIRYDQRSNGLSDREVDDLSFDAQLSDLETVADAAGVERFALLGISAGAALSVAYAVRHPDRVSHLILYGGRPRGWKSTGTQEDRAQRAAMVLLIRAGWGQDNPAFRQLFTSLFIPDATPEQMDWYNELQRRTVSPDHAARLHEVSGEVQIGDLLEKVAVPTLVLHSVGDALVPFDLGRELAIGIPGARFVALDSRNHILLAGEPAFGRFIDELRHFIDH
jgi:pimeloyl-ACP methyl ester carboxylesterase/DNA-binding SARP family transcriptional activator